MSTTNFRRVARRKQDSSTRHIFYGIENSYMNISDMCVALAGANQYIEIPAGDLERATLYGDPAVNSVKHILVVDQRGEKQRFDAGEAVRFKKGDITVTTTYQGRVRVNVNIADPTIRLRNMQARLKFTGGSIRDEHVEQLMSTMFIRPQDTVLELGSNIGRNSLIISAILDDESRLVTLETDLGTVTTLNQNKEANGFKFNVVNAALSKQKLIQQGWNTMPSETVLPGYFPVNTVTLDELNRKFNLAFNVLVADCEGALYYILQEFPNLLQGAMTTLIIENDYAVIEHKQFVDECFTNNGFVRIFSFGGGWGPCADSFWEVWQRK